MNAKANSKNSRKLLVKPILRFVQDESFSGVLLIIATAIALIWANSPFGESYFHFFETKISFDIGGVGLSKTLHHWINDGLMVIFFFMIGMEIKREIMVGELSQPRKAMLPILAAIGGMLFPALIYVSLNAGNPDYLNGWAIPVATDIAFALGILAILGKRVPLALKVFLSALAIVDDMGAVLSIAIFYTEDLSLMYLAMGLAGFLVMFLLNYMGVRNIFFYAVIGILGLWLPILLSGVHATVAGVLAALTIPTARKIDTQVFADNLSYSLNHFKRITTEHKTLLLTAPEMDTIDAMRSNCRKAQSPLQQLEHNVHGFALYFVMPVFALANTGLIFSGEVLGEFFHHTVSLGIFLGLLLGKVAGISLFTLIPVKLGIAQLPNKVKSPHIIGMGFIAGIGFTMSLFISELAFSMDELTDLSKMAIFGASLVAGLTGYFILKKTLGKAEVNDKNGYHDSNSGE